MNHSINLDLTIVDPATSVHMSADSFIDWYDKFLTNILLINCRYTNDGPCTEVGDSTHDPIIVLKPPLCNNQIVTFMSYAASSNKCLKLNFFHSFLLLTERSGCSKSPKLGLPLHYDKRYKINVSVLSKDITDALQKRKKHKKGTVKR